MKELTEIKFEEMTLEQKIGFVSVGGSWRAILKDKDDLDYILSQIKAHALGALWVSCHPEENKEFAEAIRIIREAADYPLLILTDEESGFGDYMLGSPIALGYVDREDVAYAYGKAIAVGSRKAGYSMVCNPLLDRPRCNCPCGGVLRTLHPDKERSAKLAEALCRGMHDGGVLNCGKHYPSAPGIPVDSHMSESYSELSEDEVVNDSLYAYRYLMDLGLLDGVMVSHKRLVKVDPERPASLSEKTVDILRKRLGYDGLLVTDALEMMGVVAKFGTKDPKWMCIEAGNDLSLGFTEKSKDACDAIYEAYKEGKLSDEKLDSAVKRILAYQHKYYELAKKTENVELTPEEDRLVRSINEMSIAAFCDEGLTCTLPTDGRHLFVVMTQNNIDLSKPIENDTMSVSWYHPERIARRIRENFPNSGIISITEFPSPPQLSEACRVRLKYDDVVFVSFFENAPYVGREAYTPRISSLIDAWQRSDCVSAVIHYGNPFLLEELPHIPRVINACKSTACTEYAIDVLAGKLEANAKIPYKLKLQ